MGLRTRSWVRRLAVVGTLIAIASPLARDHDTFPLSTYPMYAGDQPRVVSFAIAVGYDAEGRRRRLSLGAIARTDDALIAQAAVRNAIAQGRADAFCAEIAARVARTVVRVEVVEENHDVVVWAEGGDSLVGHAVRASCGADA